MTIASRKYRIIERITSLEDEELLDRLEKLLLGEDMDLLLEAASSPMPDRIESTVEEDIHQYAPPGEEFYDQSVLKADFQSHEPIEDLIRDI